MKYEEPEIRELEERRVACVSFTGNYIGNSKVFADLFTTLSQWAGPKGLIGPQTVFLSAYYGHPAVTPPDELKLDCCLFVPGDIQAEGDIGVKTLPGGSYAVMRAELEGPSEYGAAWETLVEWMKGKKLETSMSRPGYEIYLNNPDEHPEKHHLVDICLAVGK